MNRHPSISTVIVGVVLSAVMCAAQQAPPAAPAATTSGAPTADSQSQATQPYGPLYPAPGDAAAEAKPQMVADERPLSGILGLTLGSETQNSVTTSFHFGQLFDSNAGISGTRSSGYTGESSLGGNLTLHRAARNRSLDVVYNGGALLYDDNSAHTTFHNLNLAQVFNTGRWTLTLTDALNYSPQGQFGAGLGLNNFGSGSVGLGSTNFSLTPNQSIYTPLSRQLSNTMGGQIQYGLSPRSSWTVGLTYGGLYYPDQDFGNNHQINVRSGYNRNWTAKDTVSVFYEYGAYRGGGTGGFGSNVDTHSFQLAYGRRVTGRLSWSVSGGPQISTMASSSDTDVGWTASSGLQYQRARTGLSGSYDHRVSNSLIGGSTEDSLQLGVNRSLTQRWSASANGGVARNAQLLGSTEFKSGFVGLQAQRTVGQRTSIYFNYAFQRQISSGGCSAGSLCSGLSRQVWGFGFSWAPRAWLLR